MDEMNEKFNENLGIYQGNAGAVIEACGRRDQSTDRRSNFQMYSRRKKNSFPMYSICCGKPAKHMVYWGKAY